MPTEVLVMCEACGRPQPARSGPCVACGAALPEAPVPGSSVSEAPFLDVKLGGGRSLTGTAERLTLHPGASRAPVVMELGNLVDARLHHRLFFEALVLAAGLAGACLVLPALRPLAVLFLGAGLLTTVLWRRYVLELRTVAGASVRWPLGVLRKGSRREEQLHAAWLRLIGMLREREHGPDVPRA